MFAVLYFNSAYAAHLPSGYIPQNSGDIIRIPEQLITAALNCLAIVVKPASTLAPYNEVSFHIIPQASSPPPQWKRT